MHRWRQLTLILATVVACWLGMQAVHELGHVLAAMGTGGAVDNVVLHPLAISRTDVSHNPHPLAVVWAGPVLGVLLPVVLWLLAAALRVPGAFVLRFFAGFCLIANGAYLGIGSFQEIGDCGELLRHGASLWQLWLFGVVTIPAGLALWHGLGKSFGLGAERTPVSPGVVLVTAAIALLLVALGVWIGD